jgi:acetyl esterase/lipase
VHGFRVVVALLATLAVSACGGGSSRNVPPPKRAHGRRAKAVWGAPSGGRRPRALLILIHGGGWEGPNAAALRDEVAVAGLYRKAGYETVAVDYRAGAAGVSDVERIYRQARRRAGPHLPICAAGISAGGHIALMLAVRYPDLRCVIDVAGPTDLPALNREPHGHTVLELADHAFGAGGLAAFSPALHASSIRARLMLVYASDDPVVPVAQGRAMARADRSATLIVLPPGNSTFVHTGVGAPAATTGVRLSAKNAAQIAEDRFLNSATAPSE